MAKQQNNILRRIGKSITKFGGGVTVDDMVEKMRMNIKPGLAHGSGAAGYNQIEPPYQRQFSPMWIYRIRRNSPVVNNAMRQKIWQTFRGGLNDWEKAWDAKCPSCGHEFQGMDAFRQQMKTIEDIGDDAPEPPDEGGMPPEGGGMMADGAGMMDPMGGDEPEGIDPDDLRDDDIDLDTKRTCPECEEYVDLLTPDPDVREKAQSYFDRANCREEQQPTPLEPTDQSTISQSFVDVLEEIAWDIQSFDDGWLIFERSYQMDSDGYIYGFELDNVYRGPPELIRWSMSEQDNEPGGNYWVCVECRNRSEDYQAETQEQCCSDCGNVTYPAYAIVTNSPSGGGTGAGTGDSPSEYLIRGEFYHDSEYERGRWYGFPPVLTLWEESKTLEQMDTWYSEAYEERRAPRGAMLVNAAHDADLRQMNRQQMEKMREDPNYIPLFMNDSEEEGDPIKFVELLSDPAEMQHMEMREWFLDRIGAHFGVTAVLMDSSPGDSGMSQSMEVEVSEKQAEHFRDVLNGFIEAFVAQIGTLGWKRELCEVQEDNPEAEAQLIGQQLNNAQKALQVGAEVEWTPDDRAEIKEGELEMPDGEMDMQGMDGGVQGPRGPEPHSLDPGQDPSGPQPEGDRERAGPADEEPAEGPDDPDRPAATPLKAMLEGEGGDQRLEKIAARAFDVPKHTDDVPEGGVVDA